MHSMEFLLLVYTYKVGHKKIHFSQKRARIGMITAGQRVGLRVGPKNKNTFILLKIINFVLKKIRRKKNVHTS